MRVYFFLIAFSVISVIAFLHSNTPRTTKSRPEVTTVEMSSSGDRGDNLRLVILSDTHRVYSGLIPSGDVLIHCGDSELSGSEFNAWASELDHPYKLAVGGNMDDALKHDNSNLQNVTYLQDESVIISGIKFYGSPWTPKFVGVFQLSDERAAENVWRGIPDNVDVLITHGPPAGILDRTSRGMRVGDRKLLDRVEALKPRVHCFGHIHESYGTNRSEHTVFCNAAVFNGYNPIVVDVPLDRTKQATLVS